MAKRYGRWEEIRPDPKPAPCICHVGSVCSKECFSKELHHDGCPDRVPYFAPNPKPAPTVEEYVEHDRTCVAGQYRQGRPTEDGYEQLFGYGKDEQWYQRGEGPPCTCGLNEAIDAYRRVVEERDQARQDRYDALTVYSTDGLLSSEWVVRAGKAERENATLRAERDGLLEESYHNAKRADDYMKQNAILRTGMDKLIKAVKQQVSEIYKLIS